MWNTNSLVNTGKQQIEQIERICCPLCSSPARKLHDARDRLLRLPGEFSLWECTKCLVIFNMPRLAWEQLKTYYPETYNMGSKKPPLLINRSSRHKGILLRSIQKKHALIRKVGGKGRLLDVGCNRGDFLYGMWLLGWKDLYGLEASQAAATYAVESLGISIWTNVFPDITGLASEYFDVITLWHVMEHLDDPRHALDAIANLLAPGGVCIINIPDPSSRDRKLFKGAWYGFDVPRHYFTYPPSTFRALAVERGFQIIDEQYVDDLHGAIATSLMMAGDRFRFLKLWKLALRFSSTQITSVLFSPLFRILIAFGWHPSRAYVLKRNEGA
jgi:SAM-dependent methyltransferase